MESEEFFPEGLPVYRVEDDSGSGPYRAASGYTDDSQGAMLYQKQFRETEETEARPTPMEDGMGYGIPDDINIRTFRFGFKSLDQLSKWFDGSRAAFLKSHGFKIATYCAKTVIEGSHQLGFTMLGQPTGFVDWETINQKETDNAEKNSV